MALDDDTRAYLEAATAAAAVPTSGEQTPAAARASYDAAPRPAGDELAHVSDATVPGRGGSIPVRFYADAAQDGNGGGGRGVVVFFHGGGWVLSSVDGHDHLARRLAKLTGALVVSVDYRLAPEHPYPAPLDDCWAVTAWLTEHALDVGAAPGRLAVAGDSAGGNLAAGVALRARDEGLALSAQALIYPCLDSLQMQPSHRENGEGYFLTTGGMRWFWDQYLADGGADDPYAVPMRAEDLSGVAPALIQTAEYDPLRDEGEAYGERLAAAGVPVTITRYPGVVHGFVSRWHVMARALAAHEELAVFLRAALSGDPVAAPS